MSELDELKEEVKRLTDELRVMAAAITELYNGSEAWRYGAHAPGCQCASCEF